VEFLEHWRLRERPLEPTSATRLHFQGRDPDAALHRLKFAPDAAGQTVAAAQGNPLEVDGVTKLALEFAGLPEYPVVKVTAVNAVVRDMKRHQTLAIA
jgi:hypothetical protein